MKNKNSPRTKGVIFILITIIFGQFLITGVTAHPSGGSNYKQTGIEGNKTITNKKLVTSSVKAKEKVAAKVIEASDPKACLNQQLLCLTEECIVSAGQLIESMDLQTDPCDDFYQFSCGGWMRKHDVPKTAVKNNQFESIDDQITRDVQDILERPRPNDSREINMTRTIYESCLDTETIESVGAKPLVHLLLHSHGGWPMLTPKWNESYFDWKNVSASIRTQLGLDLFFRVETQIDPKNKDQNIIAIFPVVPAEERISIDKIDELRNVLSDTDDDESSEMFKRFHFKMNSFELEDVRDFQSSLKLIYSKSVLFNRLKRLRSESEEEGLESFVTTISSLQNSTSGYKKNGKVEWKTYLQNFFSVVNITIKSGERILVPNVNFITDLLSLLDKTPKRVIANYFHWKLIEDTVEDTKTGKRLEELLEFLGKPVDGFREMICTAKVRQLMEPAISAEYIKRFYHPKGKNEVTEIVYNLKAAFRSSLPNMGMDAATQSKALEKLASMKETIAYPEWITNATFMKNYYQGLNVNKATYFDNMRSINKVIAINDLKSLRQKRRNDEQWMSPYLYDQNAEYRPQSNALAFSLGILQSPVYKTGRLLAVNYGSLGVIAGHEIAHGLIGTGRKYNKVGKEEDWWSKETKDQFKKLSKCFVNQYNNYSILELDKSAKKKVNGTLTLEENISDLMGVSQAFKAYRSYVTLKGPEARLPGLKQFSPEQLFFVSFANKFCVNYSKEGLNQTLISDTHSPERYRIIGALSNSEEFSQHFQCPVGSRMNPSLKCKVLF